MSTEQMPKDDRVAALLWVELFTRDKVFVQRVEMLPFTPTPDAVVWGTRFFARRSDEPLNHFFEIFVVSIGNVVPEDWKPPKDET